ncbi:MAG: HEPN domain-containing protein [Bdellovibrionota bacterium]
MANKKSVLAWFGKSNEDLFAARWLRESKNQKSFVPIAFHCQQVIEKALKGFLTFHSKKFEKTHDIREIMGFVIHIDSSLDDVLKPTVELTPFAVAFRYPDALKRELTISDIDRLIALTEKAYKEILSRIPFDSPLDI